jgi:hypothetical protein
MNQEERRIAQNILKSYNPEQLQESLNEKLEKGEIDEDLFAKASEDVDIIKGGKRAVIGEKRTFGGREYIKTNDGWKFHGKGTGSKAQGHVAGSLSHHVESATGGEKKEIEPQGHKVKDAVDFGSKLQEQGKKTIEIREALEEHYPGLRDEHSDIMNQVLDKKKEVLGRQFGPKEADAAKDYMKEQSEKTGKRFRILIDSQKNFHVNDGTREVSGMQEWASHTPESKEKTPEQIEKEVRETYKQSPLHVQKQKVKEALEAHSKKVEVSHKEPIGATIENIGPGGKVTSTKDVSDKPKSDFSNIKEWTGDDYSDKQITSVIEALKTAGVTQRELKQSSSSSQEKSQEENLDRAARLVEEVNPHDLHDGLEKPDVRSIIWGMIMSGHKI